MPEKSDKSPLSNMKIVLAQPVLHIGNFEFNTRQILKSIESARQQRADLVVFCELAVCGYPPKDLLRYDAFVDACEESVQNIANECHDLTVILGGISKNPGNGPALFNSAFVLADGGIRKIIHKTLLPWYDVFDEYRYFAPGTNQNPVFEINGKQILITICEDLWDLELEKHYAVEYSNHLSSLKPDIVVNIAASPFSYTQPEARKRVSIKASEKFNAPVIYVNQLGAHADLIFDGGSSVTLPGNTSVKTGYHFSEDLILFDTEKTPEASSPNLPGKVSLIHDALIFGIKEFFEKNQFKQAILGLSGGIDSALVYYLAVKALKTENVTPVIMPSRFTSSQSVRDAKKLVDNLGGKLEDINIEPLYTSCLQALSPYLQDSSPGIAEENLQARSRAVLLMAIANKTGKVLLNTSNKSEIAFGYGTLYGDLCGAISVIGDLYKADVYDVSRYANQNNELIPQSIIDRAPTAELKEDQKDTDSLPPYEILDAILYRYIELQESPDQIIEGGFDKETVREVIQKVETSEFKRYQTPPVLRVSNKSFGDGRRIPLVAKIAY